MRAYIDRASANIPPISWLCWWVRNWKWVSKSKRKVLLSSQTCPVHRWCEIQSCTRFSEARTPQRTGQTLQLMRSMGGFAFSIFSYLSNTIFLFWNHCSLYSCLVTVDFYTCECMRHKLNPIMIFPTFGTWTKRCTINIWPVCISYRFCSLLRERVWLAHIHLLNVANKKWNKYQ